MFERFIGNRNGATAVEYGLIIAVLSLAVAMGLEVFGDAMSSMFSAQATIIDDSAAKLH